MSLTIAPEIDLESLAAVVEHRSLQEEFEPWQGRVAAACEDPFHPAELTWIARDQGAPVAFALAYVLPSTPGRFAQVRIGVRSEPAAPNVLRVTSAARFPKDGPNSVLRSVTRSLRRVVRGNDVRIEVVPEARSVP